MCHVAQQNVEELDDVNYLHLMQIVWSYSEMSDLKGLAVELPFVRFATKLKVFESSLVGRHAGAEANEVQEMRARLAESFHDFIQAVESLDPDPPAPGVEFLKGINRLFEHFSPLQRNNADPPGHSPIV